MRIRVENIPDTGRTIPAGVSDGWAVQAVTDAIGAVPTRLEMELFISAPTKRNRVEVEVEGRVLAPGTCDRCSEGLERTLPVTATLQYQPEQSEPSESEIELGEDDLDVGWYRDGNLSLSDILTEAIALALPSRTICEDSAACNARTEALLAAASEGSVGHPAFAALKNLSN